ncbi:MAG: hypothetical protein Q4D87_01945 [Actinomycetaceae bacterium]|nr:hypothetical protein [Actinomycetaceae bacterium]
MNDHPRAQVRFHFIPRLQGEHFQSHVSLEYVSSNGVSLRESGGLSSQEISAFVETLDKWSAHGELQQTNATFVETGHVCTEPAHVDMYLLEAVQSEITLKSCPQCEQLFLYFDFLSGQAEPIRENIGIPVSTPDISELRHAFENAPIQEAFWSTPSNSFEYVLAANPAVTLSRNRVVIHTPIPQVFDITMSNGEWSEVQRLIAGLSRGVEVDRFEYPGSPSNLTFQMRAQHVADPFNPGENVMLMRLNVSDSNGQTVSDIGFELAADGATVADSAHHNFADQIVLYGRTQHRVPK